MRSVPCGKRELAVKGGLAKSCPVVLVVGPCPPPYYGVSVMTEMVTQALRSAGATVLRVDTADRRPLSNIGRVDLRNVRLGLQHGGRIWRMAFRHRPNAVLIPISQAFLPLLRDALWLWGAWLAGSRVILHLHGSHLGTLHRLGGPTLRTLLRWIARRTWRVLVLSKLGIADLQNLFPAEAIRVLPNAIPDSARPPFPKRDQRPFRVVYLSNLMAAKGYLDLLRAAPLIPAGPGQLEITMAGDWFDSQEQAEALMALPAVRERVRHVGVITGAAKDELLARADLFVFPPRHAEGQPLVLLEAMAASLPIIATRSGYIPATLREGVNVVFVPPGDPPALAAAIWELLLSPERRRRMGQASRRLYSAHHTPAAFAANLAPILAELHTELLHGSPRQ